MAKFVRVESDIKSHFLINMDNVDYMYETEDKLGRHETQISFSSGKSVHFIGRISELIDSEEQN